MLYMVRKITDLRDYGTSFTLEEEDYLANCFGMIKDYALENYFPMGNRFGQVEIQLHRNSFTHSYLVVDFNNQDVYLSHRDHGCRRDNFFVENEPVSSSGWGFTLCLITVEHWDEIKGLLEEYFGDTKDVKQLCASFSV